MAVKARKTSASGGKKKSAGKAKPAAKARGKQAAAAKVGKKPAAASRPAKVIKAAKAAKPARPARPAPAGGAGRGAGIVSHLRTLRSVLEKTKRPLTQWVDLLDRVGGPELDHGTLVRILTETQRVDRWSANCIVLSYRGLYGFGEHSYLLEHQEQLDQLGEWK